MLNAGSKRIVVGGRVGSPVQTSCLIPLEELVELTGEYIRSLPRLGRGLLVGFSGGKDSIVLADLVKRYWDGEYILAYSMTGIDPPEVVRFIRHQYGGAVRFLRPRISFWEGIRRSGPPTKVRRWCCDELKKRPPLMLGREYPVQLVGTRAEESRARSRHPPVYDMGRRVVVKPMHYWCEWHIWGYIESRGLAYPRLYDEGWHRIGCVVCPFTATTSGRMAERDRKRWPGVHAKFKRVVREWWDRKRGELGEGWQDGMSFEEYMWEWYHDWVGVRKRKAAERRSGDDCRRVTGDNTGDGDCRGSSASD